MKLFKQATIIYCFFSFFFIQNMEETSPQPMWMTKEADYNMEQAPHFTKMVVCCVKGCQNCYFGFNCLEAHQERNKTINRLERKIYERTSGLVHLILYPYIKKDTTPKKEN